MIDTEGSSDWLGADDSAQQDWYVSRYFAHWTKQAVDLDPSKQTPPWMWWGPKARMRDLACCGLPWNDPARSA